MEYIEQYDLSVEFLDEAPRKVNKMSRSKTLCEKLMSSERRVMSIAFDGSTNASVAASTTRSYIESHNLPIAVYVRGGKMYMEKIG